MYLLTNPLIAHTFVYQQRSLRVSRFCSINGTTTLLTLTSAPIQFSTSNDLTTMLQKARLAACHPGCSVTEITVVFTFD